MIRDHTYTVLLMFGIIVGILLLQNRTVFEMCCDYDEGFQVELEFAWSVSADACIL